MSQGFQEDALYVGRVKRKEQVNQVEQTRAKNKHAKPVFNVVWEGSGGKGNTEFLDDTVQVN